MTTETRKRRNYTEDFRRDAVAPVTEQSYKPTEAARSLIIGDNLIQRWLRELEEEASGAQLGADEREELKRVQKEVHMLRSLRRKAQPPHQPAHRHFAQLYPKYPANHFPDHRQGR